QHLHLVDPAGREPIRSLPATIVPSRRLHYGECTMLANGDGWIASLDQMRGLLYVYDQSGVPLGRVSLAAAAGTASPRLAPIRGVGPSRGAPHALRATTWRVVPAPTCAGAHPGGAPAPSRFARSTRVCARGLAAARVAR